MEFLFEILGEFILQFVGEVLLEVGLQALAAPFRKESSAWLAAIGYAVFGAVLGALSLLVFPNYLMADKSLRVANAALSPIVAGLGMAAMGKWRARRGQAVLRIDKFAYGYLFALGFGLVRFGFASPG
jgi:hypothetical protein